jgi:hypothetical protein
MSTNADVIAMVETAFADVPRPADDELLHEDCGDGTDLESLYPIASWREMADDVAIGSYAAPSFLSPAGFRHFLPAYLCFALRHPNSGEACVSGIIWSLDPTLVGPEVRAFGRSKFTLLDDAQRATIASFLQAMTDSIYADDARRALRERTIA